MGTLAHRLPPPPPLDAFTPEARQLLRNVVRLLEPEGGEGERRPGTP